MRTAHTNMSTMSITELGTGFATVLKTFESYIHYIHSYLKHVFDDNFKVDGVNSYPNGKYLIKVNNNYGNNPFSKRTKFSKKLAFLTP